MNYPKLPLIDYDIGETNFITSVRKWFPTKKLIKLLEEK